MQTGQESYVFEYVAPALRTWKGHRATNREGGRGGVGLPCYFYEDEFMMALHEYMMRLFDPMLSRLQDSDVFLEKTPAHARYIPEMLELLPDCRIIHMLRDARDVSASMLAARESWGSVWAPRHAFRAARKWTNDVRAVRQNTKHLPASQFCEVRYEELIESPAIVLGELAQFIGLEWDGSAIAEAIANNSAENIRAGGGTSIPLGGTFGTTSETVKEPKDFVRKARANTWKEDLSRLDRLQVWLVARRQMAEAGYQWRVPW